MIFTVVRTDLQDPDTLTACFLDDYAAAWARRLFVPASTFARRDVEPDADYRPRLLGLIRDRVESRAA